MTNSLGMLFYILSILKIYKLHLLMCTIALFLDGNFLPQQMQGVTWPPSSAMSSSSMAVSIVLLSVTSS